MTLVEIAGLLGGSGIIAAASTWLTSRATGKAAVITAEADMRRVVAGEFKVLLANYTSERAELKDSLAESSRTNLVLGRQVMLLRSVILQMLPAFSHIEDSLRDAGFAVPERSFVIPPEVYDFELYQERAKA